MTFQIPNFYEKDGESFTFQIGNQKNFLQNSQKGEYYCKKCNSLLFSTESVNNLFLKDFVSFSMPETLENIEFIEFNDWIEVLCKQCRTKLGYLFLDGPEPQKTNYCINIEKLKFKYLKMN